MGKAKVFNLGVRGVNVVASPVHLVDGELTFAQNAQKTLIGEQGSIGKRYGQDLLKDVGTGPVLAIMNVALVPAPLTDPETGIEIDPGDEMRCKAYKTASTAITTATVTAVSYDAESFDLGGIHSTVTDPTRFTVPTGGDGIWLIIATASWEGRNATGGRTGSYIYKNGSTREAIAEETPDATTGDANLGTTFSCVGCLALVAGDYVEHKVRQDRGTNLNLLGATPDLTSFTMLRIYAS